MIATLSINLTTILIDEDEMWIKKMIIDSTKKNEKSHPFRDPQKRKHNSEQKIVRDEQCNLRVNRPSCPYKA